MLWLSEQIQPGLTKSFRVVFDVNPGVRDYVLEGARIRFARKPALAQTLGVLGDAAQRCTPRTRTGLALTTSRVILTRTVEWRLVGAGGRNDLEGDRSAETARARSEQTLAGQTAGPGRANRSRRQESHRPRPGVTSHATGGATAEPAGRRGSGQRRARYA